MFDGEEPFANEHSTAQKSIIYYAIVYVANWSSISKCSSAMLFMQYIIQIENIPHRRQTQIGKHSKREAQCEIEIGSNEINL